jgi:hypothetical protein
MLFTLVGPHHGFIFPPVPDFGFGVCDSMAAMSHTFTHPKRTTLYPLFMSLGTVAKRPKVDMATFHICGACFFDFQSGEKRVATGVGAGRECPRKPWVLL